MIVPSSHFVLSHYVTASISLESQFVGRKKIFSFAKIASDHACLSVCCGKFSHFPSDLQRWTSSVGIGRDPMADQSDSTSISQGKKKASRWQRSKLQNEIQIVVLAWE
ncbi:hypothetical protein VNO77_00772 [Canavalia gladiata]|uniref:Uncharacterized protein n=1 Tax=Canavalia gladiata TaxID=3824 RepID=A0AAN9R4D0_CANGL